MQNIILVSGSASSLLGRITPVRDIILQVLDEWFQARPLTYSVEEFLHEVKKWQSERYLNRNVWIRLQEHVGLEILKSIESTQVKFIGDFFLNISLPLYCEANSE